MPLQSSKVAAGIKILADHFNALWTDLVVNHDHSSGMGGTVDHADLSESGSMGGISKDHSDIDTHIEGTGSITDTPGGPQGVHGLAAAAYVAGSLGSNGTGAQLVVDIGAFSPGAGSTGSETFTGTGFASAPAVILGCYHATETMPGEMQAIVTATSATGFSWRVSSSPQPKPSTVYWIAIGTK